MRVKTNDLKKGTRVKLACGWYATLEDNKKGTTRMATVEGIVTEMGSVYAHDIVEAFVFASPAGGVMEREMWVTVEHTTAQNNLRRHVRAMGG